MLLIISQKYHPPSSVLNSDEKTDPRFVEHKFKKNR